MLGSAVVAEFRHHPEDGQLAFSWQCSQRASPPRPMLDLPCSSRRSGCGRPARGGPPFAGATPGSGPVLQPPHRWRPHTTVRCFSSAVPISRHSPRHKSTCPSSWKNPLRHSSLLRKNVVDHRSLRRGCAHHRLGGTAAAVDDERRAPCDRPQSAGAGRGVDHDTCAARRAWCSLPRTPEKLTPQGVATLVEPFQRGTERIRPDHEGVGLGLVIVKSITKAHHELSSSPPGTPAASA